MFDSVLRVFADNFDVDAFLSRHPLAVPIQVFKVGEADMFGNPNTESGFDALMSQSENINEHIVEIHAFLSANEALFLELKGTATQCIIDIGLSVAADDQLPASVQLPADLLGLFGQLGISIEIAAYPETTEAG